MSSISSSYDIIIGLTWCRYNTILGSYVVTKLGMIVFSAYTMFYQKQTV